MLSLLLSASSAVAAPVSLAAIAPRLSHTFTTPASILISGGHTLGACEIPYGNDVVGACVNDRARCGEQISASTAYGSILAAVVDVCGDPAGEPTLGLTVAAAEALGGNKNDGRVASVNWEFEHQWKRNNDGSVFFNPSASILVSGGNTVGACEVPYSNEVVGACVNIRARCGETITASTASGLITATVVDVCGDPADEPVLGLTVAAAQALGASPNDGNVKGVTWSFDHQWMARTEGTGISNFFNPSGSILISGGNTVGACEIPYSNDVMGACVNTRTRCGETITASTASGLITTTVVDVCGDPAGEPTIGFTVAAAQALGASPNDGNVKGITWRFDHQ